MEPLTRMPEKHAHREDRDLQCLSWIQPWRHSDWQAAIVAECKRPRHLDDDAEPGAATAQIVVTVSHR